MAKTNTAVTAPPDEYETMIAEAAYYKAERRGFAPGHEVADWLAAERELLDQIMLLDEPKPAAKRPRKSKKLVANAKK